MITHFETTVTLLAAVIGMLATLIAVVWKSRGYLDRLNTTDSDLAHAIQGLADVQKMQHRQNQRRFKSIERKLERGR